jgi:serine O-acetyltransferase
MNLFSLIHSDFKKHKKYGGNFITIVFFTKRFLISLQYCCAKCEYNINFLVVKQFKTI